MFWVLLGVGVGGLYLAMCATVSAAAAPVDLLVAAISDASAGGAGAVVRALGLGADTVLAHCASAVAAAVVPALVCLAVAEAVTTSRAARNAAVTLLTVAALLSFLWLPGQSALLLVVVALAFGVLLAVGRGVFLQMPAAALVTAVTGRLVLDIAHGAPRLAPSVASLSASVGGGPGLWRAALAVVVIVPAVASVAMLARDH